MEKLENTADITELKTMLEKHYKYTGSKKAKKILDALIYQVSKEVGFVAPVLCGKFDAIILTGGMAHSEYICNDMACI